MVDSLETGDLEARALAVAEAAAGAARPNPAFATWQFCSGGYRGVEAPTYDWHARDTKAIPGKINLRDLSGFRRSDFYTDTVMGGIGRDLCIGRYAWAVPDERVLQRIVSETPIVEMGAGTGYWAQLLRDRGADVVAYDSRPGAYAHWRGDEQTSPARVFGEVRRGGPPVLRGHANRTLLLVWPPLAGGLEGPCLGRCMGCRSLRAWKGSTLIYVGEGYGGCTACDGFHERIDSEFEEVEELGVPQWWGLNDAMWVFRRRDA